MAALLQLSAKFIVTTLPTTLPEWSCCRYECNGVFDPLTGLISIMPAPDVDALSPDHDHWKSTHLLCIAELVLQKFSVFNKMCPFLFTVIIFTKVRVDGPQQLLSRLLVTCLRKWLTCNFLRYRSKMTISWSALK